MKQADERLYLRNNTRKRSVARRRCRSIGHRFDLPALLASYSNPRQVVHTHRPRVLSSINCTDQRRWRTEAREVTESLGPDFPKILYNNLATILRSIMPMLRSTYDGRLIHKTSYEEWKAFLSYDSLS